MTQFPQFPNTKVRYCILRTDDPIEKNPRRQLEKVLTLCELNHQVSGHSWDLNVYDDEYTLRRTLHPLDPEIAWLRGDTHPASPTDVYLRFCIWGRHLTAEAVEKLLPSQLWRKTLRYDGWRLRGLSTRQASFPVALWMCMDVVSRLHDMCTCVDYRHSKLRSKLRFLVPVNYPLSKHHKLLKERGCTPLLMDHDASSIEG